MPHLLTLIISCIYFGTEAVCAERQKMMPLCGGWYNRNLFVFRIFLFGMENEMRTRSQNILENYQRDLLDYIRILYILSKCGMWIVQTLTFEAKKELYVC